MSKLVLADDEPDSNVEFRVPSEQPKFANVTELGFFNHHDGLRKES